MLRNFLIAVAGVMLLASCSDSGDCTVAAAGCEPYFPLSYEVAPRLLTLAVGDTATIELTVRQGNRTASSTVRWTPSSPVIVALDDAAAMLPRVSLRATTVGSSWVQFTIVLQGQSVSGVVPVTVIR